MASDFYNPFQTSELRLPRKFRERIDGLMSRGNDLPRRETPFGKYVDFWFLAACVAIHDDVKVEELNEELQDTWRFEFGTVLLSGQNRIALMEIVGKGILENSQATPNEIARLFNTYATLGTEKLITEIENGGEDSAPLWILLDYVKSAL